MRAGDQKLMIDLDWPYAYYIAMHYWLCIATQFICYYRPFLFLPLQTQAFPSLLFIIVLHTHKKHVKPTYGRGNLTQSVSMHNKEPHLQSHYFNEKFHNNNLQWYTSFSNLLVCVELVHVLQTLWPVHQYISHDCHMTVFTCTLSMRSCVNCRVSWRSLRTNESQGTCERIWVCALTS